MSRHSPYGTLFILKGAEKMAESKIRDDNYFQVSGWMLNKLKLKGITLEVFAIIYGFSQDGESEFTGSLQYLCDFTGTSKPTVIKALKDLTELEYLIKTEQIINGVQFNRYKANLPVVKNLYEGSKETLLGGSKNSLMGGSKEYLPNNKSLNNKSLNNKNNIYISVVEYLNEKAGTSYRSKSKDTQKHINARLAEGYTVDDFKSVIDKKCAEWKGTDFEQYLRPATLFGTKFENYLNSKATKHQVEKQEPKRYGGTYL